MYKTKYYVSIITYKALNQISVTTDYQVIHTIMFHNQSVFLSKLTFQTQIKEKNR